MPEQASALQNDEREVRQRKQEIEAISHEKWLAMSNEYLGNSEAMSWELAPSSHI